MEDIHSKRMMWTGLTGSAIAAICCFTPILVVLLGVVGLGAMTGYLDYVLLPVLAGFLGLTMYGLFREKHTPEGTCCMVHEPKDQER